MGNAPVSRETPADFRANSLLPNHFQQASQNFYIEGDRWIPRPGYRIVRKFVSPPSTVAYIERMRVDQSNATLRAALWYADSIYEDANPPVSRKSGLVNPYGAAANRLPSTAYADGRLVFCNGTNFGVCVHDGTQLLVRDALTDPGNPTLGTAAAGSLTAGTWYVRIRWYDSVTKTYSGPNARTGTAGSVSTSPGTQKITVDISALSIPSRATHWQVQLARTLDVPAQHEITSEVGSSGGLIAVGTTNVTLTLDPTSGTRFPYRSTALSTRYQHSNPPTGAAFVTFFQSRAFYACPTDRWLVWSETDNPEHFYHSTDDPNLGFNTMSGDGLGNHLISPCTALASNESTLFYFSLTSVHGGEGTWGLVFDENDYVVGRNARVFSISTVTGSICPSIAVVDQEVYFLSHDGFKAISGRSVIDIDTPAVKIVWNTRDPAYEHRYKIAYDPQTRCVLFLVVTKTTSVAGAPNLVFAWSREKQRWCPPWTLPASSMTLHRLLTDAGENRGVRLLLGGWYGTIQEFGWGDGDGTDASSAVYDPVNSTSDSSTSVTKTGAGWTADAFVDHSLVLVDRSSGRAYQKRIKGNTATVLSWEGTLDDAGSGWTFYIAGIHRRLHYTEVGGRMEVTIWSANQLLDDQVSRRVV